MLAALLIIYQLAAMLDWRRWPAALGQVLAPGRGSGRQGWPPLLTPATLSGLWVGACVWGIGYGLLGFRRARRMLTHPGERLAFAPLLGTLALGLAIQLTGLISTDARLLGLLGLLGLLAALPGWRQILKEMRQSSAGPAKHHRGWGALLIKLLAGLVLAISFVYACAPSVESDELRYHLAAPLTWLRWGRIEYIPHQAFSNFPFLAEMLYLQTMAQGWAMLGNAGLMNATSKLLHWMMLPTNMLLTGWLTLRLARLLSPADGEGRYSAAPLPAALAWLFIPSVPILAGWGFIDLFVSAYFLGFVYLTLRGLERPGRASAWLLGAICAGGIGVKYSLLPLLGGLGLLWWGVLWLRPASRRRALGLGLGTVAVTILLGGVWYLRNWFWTHNPFYPLAWGIFGGEDWSAAHASFYMDRVVSKGIPLAADGGAMDRILNFLATPLTTTFHFMHFEAHALGALPLLGGLLLLGFFALPGQGPLCMLRACKRPSGTNRLPALWFALTLLASWGFWYLTYQSNRMLLPTIGLVLAAAGAAWGRWASQQNPWGRSLARGAYLAAVCFGFAFYIAVMGSGTPLKADALAYELGRKSRDTYLADYVPWLPALERLSERLRDEGDALQNHPGILFIGEHRTMHITPAMLFEPIASDWFDTPQPLPLIRATPDNDAMLDLLYANGTRHILYNWGELFRYHDARAGGGAWEAFAARYLNPRELQNLERYWNSPALRDFFRTRMSEAEYQRFATLWQSPRLRPLPQASAPGVLMFEIME